jgi:hypothetical protein
MSTSILDRMLYAPSAEPREPARWELFQRTRPRLLDRKRWTRTREMAELLDARVIYIYQLEWARIPFYVGLTTDPRKRLAHHLTDLWRGDVAHRLPNTLYPQTFNLVIRAARVGLNPSMRLIDVYVRYPLFLLYLKPRLCEAGWIVRRRAQGQTVTAAAAVISEAVRRPAWAWAGVHEGGSPRRRRGIDDAHAALRGVGDAAQQRGAHPARRRPPAVGRDPRA